MGDLGHKTDVPRNPKLGIRGCLQGDGSPAVRKIMHEEDGGSAMDDLLGLDPELLR
jgi:hypothetical protein